MKTRNARRDLMEAFGYDSWEELKANLKEAKEPFPIVMSWKCIATGRKRDGRACIFEKSIEENKDVDASYVSEEYSWLRLYGNPTIWKFLNPLDMKEKIREFDQDGLTDMEEGDMFILEPLSKICARSAEYQRERREAIKNGTRTVKPRGPNVNPRRTPVHHFRPY